ncbi:TOM1-like protein 2 isoform X1 [Diabrotica virgifera virgifera]|uniref:TOM1-like protein 2 isoform X1 n=1 Tax=Diabrotica virgifera virgifera TaxID=50390 RepID=A0A6P7GUH4_DIAVI|nr:TOM1-like protein 2 isoform X1 [Diabrotica virgifera virgifera]
MSFISNALIGNPFSTAVGGRIEQATDGTLASENWALNMEICDLVNETEDGPRDAIKAIRKRLTQNAGKNYTVVMYALTILETCVKNCGKRFHVLVCNKDFIQELVKLIGPKNDPPTAVQEKVLSLIQSWASAFQNQPDMSGVTAVYQDLLAKGIEFPPTDLDSLAPIHTPKKSVSGTEMPLPTEPVPPAQASPRHAQTSPGVLTPEQRAKLQSELDVIQSNMAVLGEMLVELKPGEEQPDELELLQELHATCQSMQHRLVELVSKISNDGLCEELLRINDELNNLFLRYSRWEKNRDVGMKQSASAVLAKAIPPTTKPPLEASDSLIDFDDDISKNLNGLTLTPNKAAGDSSANKIDDKVPSDEFDMFAQSRNVTYESSKQSGSTYKDNLNPDQISGGLSTVTQKNQSNNPEDLEIDEMAGWLGRTSGVEESVTSSDFDRFLAERAAAAESLPSIACATNTKSTSSPKDKKPDQSAA